MREVTLDHWPKVIPNDYGIRPAGPQDACFYCRQQIGEFHGSTCVCVEKRVKYTVFHGDDHVGYFTRLEPYIWNNAWCEQHKNESSYCADNAVDDIEWLDTPAAKTAIAAVQGNESCACGILWFYVHEVVDPGPIVIYREETDAA